MAGAFDNGSDQDFTLKLQRSQQRTTLPQHREAGVVATKISR
jgi:hypothetical protein